MLEDVVTDAELAVRELRRAGLVVTSLRVETETSFVRALNRWRATLTSTSRSI